MNKILFSFYELELSKEQPGSIGMTETRFLLLEKLNFSRKIEM